MTDAPTRMSAPPSPQRASRSGAGPSIDIGSVMVRTFSIWWRNLVPFTLLVGLVLSPVLILNLLNGEKMGRLMESAGNEQLMVEDLLSMIFLPLIAGMLQMFLLPVASAAIVYGVFQDLRSERATIGSCLGVGLRRALPVLGITLLVVLASGVAMMVCCLPYFWVMSVLYIVVPVAVIERVGMDAFERSLALTKGSRWGIVGLVLVFMVAVQMVSAGLIVWIVQALVGYLPSVVVGWFLAVFTTALLAVSQSVTYHDLRVLKEGLAADDLARIFE